MQIMGCNLKLSDDTETRIYTVTEITEKIREILESSFENIWVEGEVSNFRCPLSGHFYFTLKDEMSQIRAVMFRSQNRLMEFQPEDGMEVLSRGRLSVYGPRGEYQLVIDYIEPKGIGALQLAFEKLKERLQKEGLFDQSRKKPLPYLPRRIAVVTSPTGAAIRDILKVIFGRFPNLEVLVVPVRVQGEGAANDIARAIHEVNTLEGIDLMILARGGGSMEDLWPFNEEVVARAIFKSSIPVVSAIGHEIDFTISDFVADLRAPTPSAAGELIVREKKKLIEEIQDLKNGLERAIRLDIKRKRDSIIQVVKGLVDPRRRIAEIRLWIDDHENDLIRSMKVLLSQNRNVLNNEIRSLYYLNPSKEIRDCREEFYKTFNSLKLAGERYIDSLRQMLERLINSLDSMSPLSVLSRGYSIVRKLPSLEIIRDSSSLNKEDLLHIKFHTGEAICRVDRVDDGG
jgi:exodeoxyribonuclease VII large subunit